MSYGPKKMRMQIDAEEDLIRAIDEWRIKLPMPIPPRAEAIRILLWKALRESPAADPV